jgi:hypothetical protein
MITAMPKNPNLEILESTVHHLGSLSDRMVFLGGCASGLLLTDPAAPPLRVTRDVDVIVEVASLPDYHRLHAKLRKKGFIEDLSDRAPICRWKKESLILDIMPTDPSILGFGNRWFSMAFSEAEPLSLPSGAQIRILTAPYFLATKLEAFDCRGEGDYLMSRDMEDVITVLDGRESIVSEVLAAKPTLKSYLAKRFSTLLETQLFLDSLPGHLPPDEASQSRSLHILERAKAIAGCDPQ